MRRPADKIADPAVGGIGWKSAPIEERTRVTAKGFLTIGPNPFRPVFLNNHQAVGKIGSARRFQDLIQQKPTELHTKAGFNAMRILPAGIARPC